MAQIAQKRNEEKGLFFVEKDAIIPSTLSFFEKEVEK